MQLFESEICVILERERPNFSLALISVLNIRRMFYVYFFKLYTIQLILNMEQFSNIQIPEDTADQSRKRRTRNTNLTRRKFYRIFGDNLKQ